MSALVDFSGGFPEAIFGRNGNLKNVDQDIYAKLETVFER